MNRLFEVVFSVGTDSSTQWVTTHVTGQNPNQAQALVEAQYGRECLVYSVRDVS